MIRHCGRPQRDARTLSPALTMPRTVAGWDKVGDRFYRRVELYKPQFPEDVDLAHHVVAGAPFSGAIGEAL